MSGDGRRTSRAAVRRGSPRRADLGQHFLASATLANQIVADANITSNDHVLEPGCGTGVLTAAIAAHAGLVTAVEVDASLVDATARRFADTANVVVLHTDATTVPLPVSPFRVVGNPAFNATAALLHHLLDFAPGQSPHGLTRADLVVQWQVARQRATVTNDLQGATWAPWWTFRRGRRIPAALFRPAPNVDAAVLVVERRAEPLVPARHFGDYAAFVRREFVKRDDAASTPFETWVMRYQRLEQTAP